MRDRRTVRSLCVHTVYGTPSYWYFKQVQAAMTELKIKQMLELDEPQSSVRHFQIGASSFRQASHQF
jgi:hypothetical protein